LVQEAELYQAVRAGDEILKKVLPNENREEKKACHWIKHKRKWDNLGEVTQFLSY